MPAGASLTIPQPITLEPDLARLADQIAALPSAGVYALRAPPHAPYLSWSSNLRRRLTRLLLSTRSGASPIARLRGSLTSLECWPTGSRLETSLLLYELSKIYYPDEYLARLRLRLPWFVGLTNGDTFPRVRVVNRISRRNGPTYGPFPNRDAAQRYEQELLGLFQIRRCTDSFTPDPQHPGCIYGEMNQCLRPCQSAVTPEEYGLEVWRVSEFLATNGKASVAALSAARDRACEETDFEHAAQIHNRLEKVAVANAARDAVVKDIHQFNGVALTRAAGERQFRLWPMLAALWQEPIALDFSAEEAHAKSLDSELRERITQCLSAARTGGKPAEELALFSRWYFSSWRDGEWFPFGTPADLNYRRLVREISKMVKAEAARPS